MTRPLALALALTLVGCGPPGRLNGTVRDRASLAFNEVRAQFLVDQLSIRYLDTRGPAVQEPVRLTIPSAMAVDGAEVTLPARGVLVEHFVVREDDQGKLVREEPFPPVKEGQLKLDKVNITQGMVIEGEFHLVFTGVLDTLNGDFAATVTLP